MKKDPSETSERRTSGLPAGFATRLAALAALLLLPLYALAVFDAYEAYARQEADIYSNAAQLARIVAIEQRQATASVRPLLTTLSRIPEVRTFDNGNCASLLADVLSRESGILNIGVVAPDGMLACSGVTPSGPLDLGDRTWFRRAVQAKTFASGDFEVGKVTGVRSINFALPFYGADGGLAGVVYAAVDLQAFGDILRSARVPADTALTEIDRNGVVIARVPDTNGIIGQQMAEAPVAKYILAGPMREGTYHGAGFTGVRRFFAFTPLDPSVSSSPYVIVGFAESQLLASVERGLAINLLVLAAVTLLVLLIADVGARLVIFARIREMQEVERMQREFVSLASHQLRTPVTSVRWLLELLLDGKPDPLTAGQRELVTEAKRAADDLAALAGELLKVSRPGDVAVIRPRPTDLIATVRAAIDAVSGEARRRKVRIETASGPAVPKAMVDPSLTQQVVTNLLVNAMKYSSEGAVVSVRVSAKKGAVRIEVEDRGIGIPAAEQSRVFERFYRASNVRELRSEGLGLGLHLSKSFVERMGGKIGFTSEEGRGSVFWVTFPS